MMMMTKKLYMTNGRLTVRLLTRLRDGGWVCMLHYLQRDTEAWLPVRELACSDEAMADRAQAKLVARLTEQGFRQLQTIRRRGE